MNWRNYMIRETLIKKFKYFKDVDFDHAFDNLTEVFTRDVIQNYMRYLVKNNIPFSLFIADVDNFKYVNDGYGHHAGDGVLTCVAQFLADMLGDRGVVGRFGGDEFMLVCEGINEYDDVWEIGHEINMNIGDLKFPNKKLPPVTITMGVARFPIDSTDYEEFWSLADKALYRGKMKGRNCFIIYLESKHKNLDLKDQREVAFSPTYLHANIFSTLTGSDDLATAIRNQLMFLVSYYMYDHVCIETQEGMKFGFLHILSKFKNFKPVCLDEIEKIVDNTGMATVNKTGGYSSKLGSILRQSLEDQNIVSSVYCRMSAYGKNYGYLRIDMTDTVRIWQNDELTMIVDTARIIALLLHYNNITIDELDPGSEEEIVGKKD